MCTFDKILLEMKNKHISQKSITGLLSLNQSIFSQWETSKKKKAPTIKLAKNKF